MKLFIFITLALILPGLCLADAGDTRVIELWYCTLKDGKTAEQVAAHNSKWLAFVRKTNADIRSYGLQSVVGETQNFMFADSYPDLAAWGTAKKAMNSEEGKALDAGFYELIDCSKNRLYSSTEH